MKKAAIITSFILVIMVIRVFVFEPRKNPSGAMAPTILAGDYLLVYKWPFGHFRFANMRFGGPRLNASDSIIERGDIITFKYPKKPAIEFIKRVVALPGDRIIYQGKRLTVNGKKVNNTFNKEEEYSDKILGKQQVKIFSEVIGKKAYSIQLTYHNNDPATELTKAVVVPRDSYFVLGDNRDLSNDSRHFGFVPADTVTGTVMFIYNSYDEMLQARRWRRIGMRVK